MKESERQTIDEYDMQEAEQNEAYKKSFDGNRAYRGIAYRGGRMPSGIRDDGEFSFPSLTSTSFNPIIAKTFYDSSPDPEDIKVLLRFKLDGKGAVNVSGMSRFGPECEVLVPPDSRFRVTKPRQEGYFHMGNKRLLFSQDMSDAEKDEIEQDAGRGYMRQWKKYWVMEAREVAGPGEAQRERNNAGRAKRMEARRRLLQTRQTA